MIRLNVTYGSDRIAAAMNRAPDVMDRYAEEGLDRAAQEVARIARQEAPKASTTLTDSINIRKPGRFTRIITPGTNYADFVNEGTGIFGPRHTPSDRLPPVQSLLDWIRVCRIAPRERNMSERALAFAIGAGIAKTGTRKNDFMDRAAKHGGEVASAAMQRSMQLGLAEVMEA